MFGSLFTLGKLNTQKLLQKRRLYSTLFPGWCVFCKNNGEKINHSSIVISQSNYGIKCWLNLILSGIYLIVALIFSKMGLDQVKAVGGKAKEFSFFGFFMVFVVRNE